MAMTPSGINGVDAFVNTGYSTKPLSTAVHSQRMITLRRCP